MIKKPQNLLTRWKVITWATQLFWKRWSQILIISTSFYALLSICSRLSGCFCAVFTWNRFQTAAIVVWAFNLIKVLVGFWINRRRWFWMQVVPTTAIFSNFFTRTAQWCYYLVCRCFRINNKVFYKWSIFRSTRVFSLHTLCCLMIFFHYKDESLSHYKFRLVNIYDVHPSCACGNK